MRSARVHVHGRPAGVLRDLQDGTYEFVYDAGYDGPAVSLTMPYAVDAYRYPAFPPYFEGVLPEGPQLEGLLRLVKLDRADLFGQLVAVGEDLVGAVTVMPMAGDP